MHSNHMRLEQSLFVSLDLYDTLWGQPFSVGGMLASTFVVCYPPFNWLSKDHPCMPADFGHVVLLSCCVDNLWALYDSSFRLAKALSSRCDHV